MAAAEVVAEREAEVAVTLVACRRAVKPMVVGQSTTPLVSAPPSDVEVLHQSLDALRSRYPGVIFYLYLDRVPMSVLEQRSLAMCG